jgi:hypothetical protein
MRPNAMCAGRIGKVLVGGLVTVAAVVGSGCGVRPSDPETAFWDQYIRVMDAARLRGDFYAAEAARQNAYLAALGSRRWDAMAAVGDASARLGEEFPRVRENLRPEVHRIYCAALLRARQQESLDGVLRVSEAFADLGDRDRAREGLTVATGMLAASQRAYDADRLKALADRLDDQTSAAEDLAEVVRVPAAGSATWTR